MKKKRRRFDPNMGDRDLLLWTASALDSLQHSFDNHLKHHQAFEVGIVVAILSALGALVVQWLT